MENKQAYNNPFWVPGIEHRPQITPLNEEEITFEIDMCIGCDRCMRACPIPMSPAIDIAALNRATVTDDVSALVTRFTDECVMCGSCVPVCPVNNHRDLLMLSLKKRLGISWDGQVDMGRIFRYLPDGWDIARLIARLREQPMLSDAEMVVDNYLLHLVATAKLRTLPAQNPIFQEGAYGRELYLILEGQVELSSTDIRGQHFPVAIIRRGEYMGEHGLITGQPRTTTAQTLTTVMLLEVPEQSMRRLMEIIPPLQTFFEQVDNIRSIESILKRTTLLQGLSELDMHQLAQQASIKRFDRDEQLFREDAVQRPDRDTIHLILEGFVKVARATLPGTGRDKTDERIIAYRQGGDYFVGGLDLLSDGGAVSVSSITRVNVAEISQAALYSIFTRYPGVHQRFAERQQQYMQSAQAAQTAFFAPLHMQTPVAHQSDPQARAGLRALVGGGVVEGTEVLVIDLDKCIHCGECEEACERRHGHSRMNRQGMVVGNISIATACRHCQDPVCLLCSRAGIARHPSGEVYITESCIGCGICAERCPYDNISIVTVEDEDEKEVTPENWTRFRAFFAKETPKRRRSLPMAQHQVAPGPLALDPVAEMRKKVAIKCDLCAGYNNQACVQSCPTGAAFRINPIEFFGSTEQILRQRAK